MPLLLRDEEPDREVTLDAVYLDVVCWFWLFLAYGDTVRGGVVRVEDDVPGVPARLLDVVTKDAGADVESTWT